MNLSLFHKMFTQINTRLPSPLIPWGPFLRNCLGLKTFLFSLLSAQKYINQKLFILAAILITSSPSFAKKFQNAYLSFDLPPQWNCKLEGTEWICVSQFSKRSKEAIVILTAKQVGPADSLSAYSTYLKTPRVVNSKKGSRKSKIIKVKSQNINGHTWVDGLHIGSEVPSYYTRYLATVKKGLAILVTFSAHRDYYTKYSSDFLRAISSLRVVANQGLLSGGQRPPSVRSGNETIGAPIQEMMGQQLQIPDLPPEPQHQSQGDTLFNILGTLLILGALGFYFYSKKKGGRKKSSRPRRKK